jgi:hypothetical protein
VFGFCIVIKQLGKTMQVTGLLHRRRFRTVSALLVFNGQHVAPPETEVM